MQTIQATLRTAMAQLDAARVDAPATTARLLLSQTAGQSKEWLIAHGDEPLATDKQQHFQSLLARVMAHEPLFYVLGHREFFGLDLHIDKRVLIPRPETEMLVELALDALAQSGCAAVRGDIQVIDVGAGSGAVPIAIAKHAPAIALLATDISKDALDVARLNAARHGVMDRIAFVQADLLAGIHAAPLVITANLPYVTCAEIDGLPPEIQEHEPRVALDGGEDGLDLVRRLLSQITSMAETAGRTRLRAAFLEFGASQGEAVLQAARTILPRAQCEIKKDLAQLDRVLSIRFVHAIEQ